MTKHTDRLPYLVCELANSHGGVAADVNALIDAFADLVYTRKAIKFQVFGADTIALPDYHWYGVYQELEFDAATWKQFIAAAAVHGDVWIDAFDSYSIEIIGKNIKNISGIKLQASVLENEEVLAGLRALDLSSTQVAINVSGFDLDQVHQLVANIKAFSPRPVLQMGFQAYPTALADSALIKIGVLRAMFPELEIGIADHADGGSDFAQLLPIYAHMAGCTYIEKHLCISRSGSKYDGFSALEPHEMQRLCDRLDDLARAHTGPFVSVSERAYLEKSVQIPILRCDCNDGQRLHSGDVLFRRTDQQGIPWSAISALQESGKVLSGSKAANTTLTTRDFRDANIGVIVACRMKSSRLPKKAILPIAGVPSVERCLYQCLAIRGPDQVILATSTLAEDAVLSDFLCDGQVSFWAGDPDDVISRYVGACDHYGVDVVVRVTADCPLVSTEIVELLLEAHFKSGADYTAASQAAVGTSVEIINASSLRTVLERMGRAEHSEYMTWYFRNNPELFRINLVHLPPELIRNYRLTLDHPEDLDLFESLLAKLDPGRLTYTTKEIFEVLDEHPEIAAINAHIELKYVADQALVDMLNEKTRIPHVPVTQ